MVCRSVGFVLSVSCIFVTNLRENGEDLAKMSGQDRLSSNALSEMSRVVAQAANDSGAASNPMWQKVSSIVERFRSDGSNASDILSATESEMLYQVIGIINTDIFDAMDEEHADDVADMHEGIRRAEECNTDMAGRIHHAGGDVRVLFQSMNASRHGHASCREDESGKYTVNETKWQNFENYKQDELETPQVREFVDDVSFQWLNEFFADEEWSVWFNRSQDRYLTLREERDVAHTELEETRGWCNGNQTEYEEFSCNYKYAKTAACKAHSKCYNHSSAFYGETVARANLSEQSRKNAYRVGNIIIDHLKCMLGEACNTTNVNYSRYEFVPKDMPSKDVCTIVDAYPCSPTFMNGAYSDMPHGTSAKLCTPCNDTAHALLNTPPNECINDDGPGQADKHGTKCVDYMTAWCGLYDVAGQFNSTDLCCLCGGGHFVEPTPEPTVEPTASPTPPPTDPTLPTCIGIKSSHNKYLSATWWHGTMCACKDRRRSYERFYPQKNGGYYTLLSNHDRYVCAEDSDGTLVADREAVGAWEKFTVVWNDDGTISFLDAHGKYWKATSDGDISSTADELGAWEKFTYETC